MLRRLCVQKHLYAAESPKAPVFFPFLAGAMFFGNWAEHFEKSQKSENLFRIDLSNGRDFFNSEFLVQPF
jgi:hypothetical protein